ncbi:SusC/RagA family TonB-linked outer membrane protein [Albibacterium indicum]|uniref:SusC/RagA family TonB-linked outer membrane protein n=1 Tax=Albibacterium indicum TaxID=2292082 RepID=UPI00197F84F2|nr:TonB-dependent receptor [Pedobacter indicus]
MEKKPTINRLRIPGFLLLMLALNANANEPHALAYFESVKSKVHTKLQENQAVQQFTVRGKVTDSEGTALPGVNVALKGQTTGTTTNNEGLYTLEVPNGEGTLEFSFIGFTSQEVPINNQTEVSVVLAADTEDLEEVVVIGYGTRKRTSVTSSISKIENVKLDQVPNGRIENTLAGRIAGVSINNTRNTPGSAPQVRVRGLGSISAGNNPLVVIDGFPGGSLGQLNMNDVESIEVLKDASSTAIYGSRGAGGVIMVTTKRGAEGKAKLQLNSYYGVAKAIVHDDWLTGQEWYDYLTKYQNREFVWNGGDPSLPIFGDNRRPITYQVNPLAKDLPQTIWQDEVLQTAPIQNHSLSISGGGEKARYYVSGTFSDEDGVIKTAGYKQYSARANVDVKINDFIDLGVEINPAYNKTRIAGSNMVSLVKYPSFVGTEKVEGKYPRTYDYISTGHSGQASPYTFLYGTESYSQYFTNIGRAFVNFTLLEGLSLKTSLGTNITYGSTDYWQGGIGDKQVNTNGRAGDSRTFDLVNENVLNYNKTINEDHDIGGILGASFQQAKSRSLSMAAITNSFNNDIIKTLNNAIINPEATTQTKTEWGLISYFARANYGYKNKYLVEASFRMDGSSRFGQENKWGHFPSASVAWRVSEEDFIKSIPSISNMKLRASYGVTGNFNIGNFQYLGAVGIVNYSPGNESGNAIAQTSLENQALSWEKTKGYDLGFELGLFSDRVNIVFDYYDNRTTDMLYNMNIPAITGFNNTISNMGEVRNRGIDLELTTRNTTGDFKWSSSFNLSHNKNEVTDLGGVDERIYEYWSMGFLLRKGEPMFSFLGYKMNGIFQNEEQINSLPHLAGTKPGNPILQDTDGDGDITPADRVVLGSFQPSMLLGFTNDFSYKNFDLSIFINASLGAEMFNAENQYYEGNTLGAMRRSLVENQWWSEDEPGDGKTPAAALSQLFGYNTNTDYYIENASFLNVRNINLGYTFPNIKEGKTGIQSLRLYASVNNLFYITSSENHSYNPEGATQGEVDGINSTPGVNLGSEPINRTFVFGVNLGF